jgi:hypothetical protein
MEDRRRECLRDWLARPSWTPYEAHLLLAGLDPELTGDVRKGGWWLLPRTAEEPDDKDLDDAEMQQRIDRTAGLALTTMKPTDAIKTAYDAGLLVPWLAYALDDPECQKWLPKTVKKKVVEKRRAKEGIATRNKANSDKNARYREPMLRHASAVIAGLKSEGQFPPNLMRSGKPCKVEIIRRIQEKPPMIFSERILYQWMAKGILKL